MAHTVSQNQTLHGYGVDMVHTTEVMAIFEIFLPIVAKIWLP